MPTRRSRWFHLPERTFVEVTGRDRASFLHGFCTNDVKGLAVGQGCEAFVTTHQAKIVAWIQIAVLPDRLRLTAEPGLGPKLTAFLSRYIVSEDVELADVTAQWSTLLVSGGDIAALDAICGESLSTLAEREHRTVRLAGQEITAERRTWLQPGDLWLELSPAAVPTVGPALAAAGWLPGSAEEYEALRVAAGVPVYGIDVDEANLPQEVNRTERAISFTKGCYAGQETVARIRTYGHVNRLLVRLRVTGGASAESLRGAVLRQGTAEVGKVTSAAQDTEARTTWALGYVRRGADQPGTILAVDGGAAEVLAPDRPWALQ